MAEDPLPRLEALRGDAVERARGLLLQAQRVRADARQALAGARTQQLSLERAQHEARAGFAQAPSVFALRAAELRLRGLQADLRTASQRVLRLVRGEQLAEQQQRVRLEELRAAEVARRAVARGIERRAEAVSLRSERHAEDEADDQYRATVRRHHALHPPRR